MLQDIEKQGLGRFLKTDYDEHELAQFGLSCIVVSLNPFFIKKALHMLL